MAFEDTGLIPEALDLAIKRINHKFKDNWFIFESPKLVSQRECQAKSHIQKKYSAVMELHSHSFIEIYLCIKGSGTLALNDNIYDVSEGDLALILPGQMHHERPLINCSYKALWLIIDYKRVMLHMLEINENNEMYIRGGHCLTSEHLYSLHIHNIMSELSYGAIYAMEFIKCHVLQILITAARFISTKVDGSVKNRSWHENIVMEIENFVKQNLPLSIRLEDISRAVCISPNHLNSIFKSIAGITIMQYVQTCKINKAKELLASTNESISSISLQLGYYDPFHFTKSFKKEIGISPKEFRKSLSLI